MKKIIISYILVVSLLVAQEIVLKDTILGVSSIDIKNFNDSDKHFLCSIAISGIDLYVSDKSIKKEYKLFWEKNNCINYFPELKEKIPEVVIIDINYWC